MNDSANLRFDGSKTVNGSLEPTTFDDLDFRELHETNLKDEEEWDGEGTADFAYEQDEADAEGDEQAFPNENEAAHEPEEMIVTLKGGKEVPLQELKVGYMRGCDYRYKNQDLANRGRELEIMSSRVAATANAVAELIAAQIPDEPPEELRLYEPQAYQRQWALHEAALERLARMMALGEETADVAAELQAAASEERLEVENAKLLEAFPQTRHDEGRRAFFADAFETAREVGFSDEEVREVVDHRLFKLAHHARLGLLAERSRARALQKVAAAPAAVPRLKAKNKTQLQDRVSREAMQRLARTGSMRDAMAVDFE